VTSIAQLPLLNITGTGNVKPNLMLLYDNSGSMASAFTPDYVDDSSTCRSRATMAGGTRGCSVGQPPFNSATSTASTTTRRSRTRRRSRPTARPMRR
jgi:type IV pilus assembly protein PilY1